MAMTPEGRVLKSIQRHLDGLIKEGHPVWHVKVHGGPYQRRGLPDLHITYFGRSVWIEVKREGASPTPLQVATLRSLAKAGAVTGVADSLEAALKILEMAREPSVVVDLPR